MEISIFFPPNMPIVTLPSSRRPRLFVPTRTPAERWRHSAFYPGFRLTGHIFRGLVRAKALLGIGSVWYSSGDAWLLHGFVGDVLPNVRSAAVLLGVPGPTQSVTVQLWDRSRVIGYLKYAEALAARARLEQEQRMLCSLPTGVGPALLKYGAFQGGMALVTEAVTGRQPAAMCPPPPALRGFMGKLTTPETHPVAGHPWVQALIRELPAGLEQWLQPLASREWPVVFQHGDFTPWNLAFDQGVTLRAIDWEYGSVKGFPCLDLAHYCLQVAHFIYRWPPIRAKRYAVSYLAQTPWPGLHVREAEAIASLSAIYAAHLLRVDGQPETTPLQVWRRAVWEQAL
jgi:hypothetical protein